MSKELLSQLGSLKSGTGFPEKWQGKTTGSVPFYKVSDMNLAGNATRMVGAKNYLDESDIKEMRVKPFSEEAVVFAKVGAAIFLERKRRASPPFLLDNNMMAFIPNEKLDVEFALFALQATTLSKLAQTGGLPSYNSQTLSHLGLFAPSLPEQRKIAEFFSLLDERIGEQEVKVALLQKQKRGYMQRIFSQELRFRQEDGSEYPKWGTATLDSVAQRVTRKNANAKVNLVLTLSGEQGLVDQRNYFNKNIASKNTSGYTLLEKGEFAYNKSYSKWAPYGATRQLKRYERGVVSPLYLCFRLTNDGLLDDYAAHYFSSTFWDIQIADFAAEGARNHGMLNIAISDFFKMKVLMPVPREQRQISNFLHLLDYRISIEEKKVALLRREKAGYLARIFE